MLDKFVAAKQSEIARLNQELEIDNIEARPGLDWPAVFSATEKISIIAEVKRASPSRGILAEHLDPAETARSYADSGAAMVSVVTDQQFFGAEPGLFRAVRAAVQIPVLRKDFIIDPMQIYESAALGADMVLLIAALHDYPTLLLLCEKCRELGMEPLVETHTRSEIDMSVDLPVKCVGVNNRNLKDFRVDINTSLGLARYIPDKFIRISESGIKTPDDLEVLYRHGYQGALIGENLLTSGDPGQKLRAMLVMGGEDDDPA